MSTYHENVATHNLDHLKTDDGVSDTLSPESGEHPQENKTSVKHRRNYQACEPCRERKIKCDLGPVDNPLPLPCVTCKRQSKKCWFRETRKKEIKTNDVEPPTKRARIDSSHSTRTFATLPASPHIGHTYAYQSSPLSPSRPSISATPPSVHALPQPTIGNLPPLPRSTPTSLPRPNTGATGLQEHAESPYNNLSVPARTTNGDDHVAMPKASSLAESFTNTTDNLSVLVRAATTTQPLDSTGRLQHNRSLTGSASDINIRSLPGPEAKAYKQAQQVWAKMRFVRAGWFTADEAMQYVEYFYTHLAPMTPVVIDRFRNPATHYQLLTEEPILALAILAITSRYYELRSDSKVSRGYYIHEQLCTSFRNIVQRLFWCQEQFGGGFTGAGQVSTQRTASGQITWKGSLRSLGTIEALLLLADWQPRGLHFPPGDDENSLVGTNLSLFGDEPSAPQNSSNLPYATWLEPAWRSDRMSRSLVGLAQSLGYELGVFDRAHEYCNGDHGPMSDCLRRRRLRRLVIVYISQISGRMGIQSSLSPEQDDDPHGPDANEPVDMMQKLWFDIGSLMYDANRDIFPSPRKNATYIENGHYHTLIGQYAPRLKRWTNNYCAVEEYIKPQMRVVLRMEYEYARLYVYSLGLQKVVGQLAVQNRNSVGRGLATQLGSVYDDNKAYIDEVRNAATQILELSCYGMGNSKSLGYSPVRTFLRTLSALMFSLKLLSLGNEERAVRAVFRLLKETTKRMSEQVADDVHLAAHVARLIQKLMEDVHGSMVRIPKPGSRGQSRHISPQPHNTTMSYTSDQESPDPLGQIPMADYANQTLMPPFGLENSASYDANMIFDANVDPSLFSSGDDWIGMPLDNLFDLGDDTVHTGFGGIGPTLGNRDMLSLITGSHLDQNQHGLGSGMPTSLRPYGNGY
ncbi:zinc finger transcriptional activator [Lithohypha guttulata]|uniref:zinc finger transcriptional activator n=1 Tax=Lithohypha guttulata TaxID=1690604 RepID=UPI002DE10A35|nr:zinc finger transcriptional activator [Lithohypha guttulata]